MHMQLTEDDFREALSAAEVTELKEREGKSALLSSGDAKSIIDMLPKVLARRISDMLPKGFVVQSIQMNIEVSASVFGTGLGGNVSVQFGPEKLA